MTRSKAAARRSADVILLDERGQEYNASALVNSWRGGNSESRISRSWAVGDSTINALLAGDVAQLRRLSRDLLRKNAWAQSGHDSYVANAVGTGIVPHPETDDDALRRDLLDAWVEFSETCDADGRVDIYGMQALVERSRKDGGETFIRLRDRSSRDGLAIPLQLQCLEAELVDPSYEELLPDGQTRAGIEFDPVGRRRAYHMWREHPGEIVSLKNTTRVRVPAENVLHVFRQLRPGQIRGVPDNAAIISKLWELDKYDIAELVRKQIAAMFAAFVLKPDEQSDPIGAGKVEGKDKDGTPLARLEPGTLQELRPGEDVKFSTAPSDASYSPFVTYQLRQVASALGVTYEQLTGDLSGVNFSSIRAGLIEFRRRIQQHQRNVLVFQFCMPVWRRFVTAAVLAGRVRVPDDPKRLRELTRVTWKATPGWEYVDPEKEVRALIARMRAGLTSRSRAVTEQGLDVDAQQLEREIAADNERADDLDLRFSGDARFPENGAAPAARFGGAPGGGGGPPALLDENRQEEVEGRVRFLMQQLLVEGAGL